MSKMNVKSYDTLYKLFQEFLQTKNVSGDEFIEAKLTSPNAPNLTEAEIEKFISIVTHKDFLNAVKNDFVSHYKVQHCNDARIMMILFVILFASDNMDAKSLYKIFEELKSAFKYKLLQYFWHDNSLVQTAFTGCKFFEDSYVVNKIINPLLQKAEMLKEVHELLLTAKIKKRMPKPPTVPFHVGVLLRKKPSPTVPLNTPADITFQAQEIPLSLYRADVYIDKKLQEEFEKNRAKAEKLLAQAKALDKNYCKPKKPVVREESPRTYFKAKKAPRITKHIEIKGNVATVLREATHCIREQEKEIKQIEAIIQGGSTLDKYKELEENVRELEEKKSLEDIERKHLEGQLTFEEAVLAKRKLIECNKERFKEFMEEREKFIQQIEEWKEEQYEKMKLMVQKTQEIERNAKESEKKFKEEKKNQVNQFKDEKKRLLEEAHKKQEEELAKKIKLIKEIKTLHQLKSLHEVKSFNPNECPDLGLLCQMSIADLQEKLSDMRMKMERELEQKRKCIQKYREKQRHMIENVKNFITQTRMSKPKRTFVPIRPAKLAPSPDLDKLKSRLEKMREQRRKNLKLDDVPCPISRKYTVFTTL